MSTAIKVENLSKIYRLGQIGTGTISQDVQRWFTTKVLGKEDPFLKIGQTNDRTQKGESDVVYSLQDINFEIEQGDAVGIIGRNGAGKSTLLKILSRVTAPTTGRINVKGRVASLLEVGTGFHPELTGRENIYLNGAILGMRKKEITRKLDEIIDFSGVERYVDTPVKRYSSGMYVRLAFAVAAHLESEILIVDEVLAVGDAEFQKKCLGKMGDVQKSDGRTVLFVSHNMEAVASLCNNAIWLNNGNVKMISNSTNVINKYLYNDVSSKSKILFEEMKDLERSGSNQLARFIDFEIYNESNINTLIFNLDDKINFKIKVELKNNTSNLEFGIAISNMKGVRFHHIISTWETTKWEALDKGISTLKIQTESIKLYPGEYMISIWCRDKNQAKSDDFIENVTKITIAKTNTQIQKQLDRFTSNGGVFLKSTWQLE